MKNTFTLIGLVLFGMALSACGMAAQAAPAHAAIHQVPDSIQDPELIEAWKLIDQQSEPIQLWDGRNLTGHELAQFVIKHDIPIKWGSADICNGNSCSQLKCNDGECTKFHEDLGDKPIYITPTLQGRTNETDELIDTMAHEIFHYIQPFGLVENTVFAEYWANYVGAAVAGKSLLEFGEYNPLNPACLGLWLSRHFLYEGYKHLNVYPATLFSQVDPSSQTCPQPSGVIEQADALNRPTCGLENTNRLDCQFAHASTPTPEYIVVCTEYEGGLRGCETVKSKNNP